MTHEFDPIALAAEAGRLLAARGWMLATAESCTGGLIGHWITEVPGSSVYYVGGVVAYADEAKARLLGVPTQEICAHGAVSEPVALAMAQGVRAALDAQIGVSVTGIAGPTGAVPTKPVGTVFIGVATPTVQRVERHQWPHDRSGNKVASARRALEMVIEALAES